VDMASAMGEYINLTGERRYFGFLSGASPVHIINFLSAEHPQVIALVLSFLDPILSAQLVAGFSDSLQTDVAERIACMGSVSSHVISAVEHVLEKKISMIAGNDYIYSGGIDAVVSMLNNTDRWTEKTIIEGVEEYDPELAVEIKRRMFLFEDMALLDDRSIQKVISQVDTQDLGKALKGTSAEVQEKFFRNMSKRAGALLREDMDFMGPILLADVTAAQEKIVGITRKLEMAGDIIVARTGEEELVV